MATAKSPIHSVPSSLEVALSCISNKELGSYENPLSQLLFRSLIGSDLKNYTTFMSVAILSLMLLLTIMMIYLIFTAPSSVNSNTGSSGSKKKRTVKVSDKNK